MQTIPKHNYELCNREGMRCIHCCSLDHTVDKESYEKLFALRKKVFDKSVRNFPEDLTLYLVILQSEPQFIDENSCIYLGLVDKSPGCMIHPSRHKGVDIRADAKLTQHSCSPLEGCYFNNYFKTRPEQKIFAEFLSEAHDWFSYSEQLRDCAVFNKQTGYVLSRLPLESISVEYVSKVMKHIHEKLRRKFPRKNKKSFSNDFETDITAIIKEAEDIGPTEDYMQNSALFQKWGYKHKHLHLVDEQPCLEKRFKQEDFLEWGYFFDGEKPMYIHKPTGEILPIQFDDVSIRSDEEVKKAMQIANGIIGFYCRGRKSA